MHLLVSPYRLAGLVLAGALALFGSEGCAGGAPTAPAFSGQSPPTQACSPAPGVTCFGRGDYVEYGAGELPVVISVPHGGALAPGTIPDRTGTTTTDLNTIELGRAIVQAFVTRTGRQPHLVVCHLRRVKLDANRDLAEATQGSAEAMQAWTEYHGFIETAARAATSTSGRGLYIDLHGHGHAIPRLELGYLLSASALGLSDAELDAGGVASASSLRLLMPFSRVPFSQVLRGATSLGGLLGAQVASVPSPATPSPGADPYFEGGYSTVRHTASIPGLQIESHYAGVRDTAATRAAFADALVTAIVRFFELHLGVRL